MNEDFYINLIYKKLSDDLNISEKEQLNKWLQESEANQQTAQEIELVWQLSGDISPDVDINLEEEFSFLEERITAEEKQEIVPSKKEFEQKSKITPSPTPTSPSPKAKTKTRTLRPFWLAAASIALLLAGGFLFRSFFTNNAMDWVAVTTNEQTKTITLSDNSTVILNKNSSFKYPKNFTEGNRLVKLKGEAFFEVTHNPQKPFIVDAGKSEIKVLGTSFNVQAYPTTKNHSVHVASGKVLFSTKNGQQKVELTKTEKGVLNIKTNNLEELTQVSPNTFAWRTQKLTYQNTSLSEVEKDLEKLYGITLDINDELKNCTINSKFNTKKDDIQSVLGILKTLFDCQIEERSKKNFALIGGKCN